MAHRHSEGHFVHCQATKPFLPLRPTTGPTGPTGPRGPKGPATDPTGPATDQDWENKDQLFNLTRKF